MNAVMVDARDNVVTLTESVDAGAEVVWPGGSVRALQAVAYGHKVAIVAIAQGARVIKYGQPIGLATIALEPGRHVHSHCLRAEE